ncbi:MAG: PepSY domain-containing protein [Pyrinomonadaceae bacterium]
MKWIRQIHLYLGAFFAPLFIFFALSGALQTFRLQEAPKGSTYNPPEWIVRFAEVHKNQRPVKDRSLAPSVSLKWLLVLMSLGLIVSSILGIYMAHKYNRDRRIVWGLIISGTILPFALLYL